MVLLFGVVFAVICEGVLGEPVDYVTEPASQPLMRVFQVLCVAQTFVRQACHELLEHLGIFWLECVNTHLSFFNGNFDGIPKVLYYHGRVLFWKRMLLPCCE